MFGNRLGLGGLVYNKNKGYREISPTYPESRIVQAPSYMQDATKALRSYTSGISDKYFIYSVACHCI